MIRVFTLEVLIVFVIIAFVIGGIIGMILMCSFIVGGDSDRHNEEADDEGKV